MGNGPNARADGVAEPPALLRREWERAAGGTSRAETAADRIEELARDVEAGSRLGTKEELRSLCGVSVGTFNETLRLLQARCVVTVRPGPGGGLFAATPSPMVRLGNSVLALDSRQTDVAEAMRVRDALDPLVVEDALWHGSPADIAELRKHLAAMAEACDGGDAVAFVHANWRLHARIAQISPNTLLRSLYGSLLDLIESHTLSVLPASEQPLPDYVRERYALHAALIDALDARDRDAALRLIAAHKPPYNRRSKYPERVMWLKLTAEPYPRLSITRQLTDDGAAYLGPFSSRRTADLAAAGIYDALRIRQCTHKLSTRVTTPACALAELGRCAAPCQHLISVNDYERDTAGPFRTATTGDPGVVVERLLARIERLAGAERFEEATTVRTRLVAFLRATIRMQRLAGLTALPELVAARPSATGGWELAVVRHGRLAAAALSPPRVHPQPTLDVALATAETVPAGPGPVPRATPEETERILAWLERPETRLVKADVGWASPASGAGRWRSLLARAEAAASVHTDVDD